MKIQNSQVDLKNQTETLVYADVGPLSLGLQQHFLVDTPDDNRVVYAQINMNLESSKLKEIKPSFSPHLCDHAGMYIIHTHLSKSSLLERLHLAKVTCTTNLPISAQARSRLSNMFEAV